MDNEQQIQASMQGLLPCHLGIVVDTVTAEEVVGHLTVATHLCTSGNILHGGTVMALADTLGAVGAFVNVPPGARTSTVENELRARRTARESLHKLRVRVGIGMALLREARRQQYPCVLPRCATKEAAPFRPNPEGRRLKSRLTALPSLAVRGVLSSRPRLVSRDFRRRRDRATCAELP